MKGCALTKISQEEIKITYHAEVTRTYGTEKELSELDLCC